MELFIGAVNSGRSTKLIKKMVQQSNLHGGRSLLLTNELPPQNVINSMTELELDQFQVMNVTFANFLQQIKISDISSAIESNVKRIGLDFPGESVIEFAYILENLGYEVYATAQIHRRTAEKTDLEKYLNSK